MRRFSQLAFIVTLALASHSLGSPGTRMRDLQKESNPVCERMRTLLEIKPLPAERGKAVLRIWDEHRSLTFTVVEDAVTIRVVWGDGDAWYSLTNAAKWEPPPNPVANPEKHLETKSRDFVYKDASFADDLRFLVSHALDFDSESSGADGATVFFDAVDANGKFSTFEVWSPNETKAPFAADICDMFDRLGPLVQDVETDLKAGPPKWNFMVRFPEVTGVNLTSEKARVCVQRAFRQRLQNLASELRRR